MVSKYDSFDSLTNIGKNIMNASCGEIYKLNHDVIIKTNNSKKRIINILKRKFFHCCFQ